MGWGDELIATGQARLMQERDPRKVAIVDRFGVRRWHDMWANNPRIARPDENVAVQILKNAPRYRPYIAEKHDSHWVWNEWECPVGEIYFSASERDFCKSYAFAVDVLIEPHNKAKASPNKNWGREKWQALVSLLRAQGRSVCQVGPQGTQTLEGVRLIVTPDFRHGCAVLAGARAAVLPEGGLHHAAAALGVPSVVLFGGYISPKQTGYATQTNLFTGGKACGARTVCAHCVCAMNAITPAAVAREVEALTR